MGYAGLHAVLDEGYIDNVAVAPDARRHGVASALLEVFCRFAAVKAAVSSQEDSMAKMFIETPLSKKMLQGGTIFDPQASFIVAEDGEEGNILGYAGLHAVLDEGYIDNVAA